MKTTKQTTAATSIEPTTTKLTLAEAQRKGAIDRVTAAYVLAKTADDQAENAYTTTIANTSQRETIEPIYQYAHAAYCDVRDLAGDVVFIESTAEVQVLARKAEVAAHAAIWLAQKAVKAAR